MPILSRQRWKYAFHTPLFIIALPNPESLAEKIHGRAIPAQLKRGQSSLTSVEIEDGESVPAAQNPADTDLSANAQPTG